MELSEGSGFLVPLKFESLYLKEEQELLPMVCAPERVTKSSMFKPRAWKNSISAVTFSWPWGTESASLEIEIRPSLRPNGTCQNGPPAIMVASLAAEVRMSAQETVLGHCLSSSALMSSITWKPLSVLLAKALLSLPWWLSKIDASQPCNVELFSSHLIHVKISFFICSKPLFY